MSLILSLQFSSLHTPEPSHGVRAGRHHVLTVGGELEIPDPSLTVTCQLHDEAEICCSPNLDLVVSSRGHEVGRVGRKLTAEAVFLVGEDLVLGVELRRLFRTPARESPDVAVTLVIYRRHVEPLGVN